MYTETTAQTSWQCYFNGCYESSRVGAVVPPRYGHTLTSVGFSTPYVVMFGGANGTKDDAATLGDTWVLTSVLPFHRSVGGSSHSFKWQNVAPIRSPGPRYKQAMASYGKDTNGMRSVMFGGCADVHCKTLLHDTWIFSGTHNSLLSISWSWTKITATPSSPQGRR